MTAATGRVGLRIPACSNKPYQPNATHMPLKAEQLSDAKVRMDVNPKEVLQASKQIFPHLRHSSFPNQLISLCLCFSWLLAGL